MKPRKPKSTGLNIYRTSNPMETYTLRQPTWWQRLWRRL